MPTGISPCDNHANIQLIERTFHSLSTLIQNVRVNHHRGDIGLTEQLLEGPNVVPILNRMGRKRMSKGLRCRRFL